MAVRPVFKAGNLARSARKIQHERATEGHGEVNGASREAHAFFLRGPPWPSLVLRVKSFLSVLQTCTQSPEEAHQ